MRSSSARPRLLAALLAPAAVGCADLGVVGLGGDDTDGFKLADTAATAHFKDALDDGDSLTFQQVFERGDGITFSGKPDPSAFLRATNAVDDDRDRQGRAPLSVLTTAAWCNRCEGFCAGHVQGGPRWDLRRPLQSRILISSLVAVPLDTLAFQYLAGYLTPAAFTTEVLSKALGVAIVWYLLKLRMDAKPAAVH